MSEESYTYTECMGSACHEFCFLKTYVKDSKVVRTEKAVLTGPESDRFECCQKGIDYARFAEHPERLLYPLKRTGKRGEGLFARITWDQALEEIGDKLNELKEKYGSESLLFTINPSGYPGSNFCLFVPIMYRFIHLYDATGCMMNSVDQSFFGAQSIDLGSMFRYNMSDPRLLSKSKHIIIWASNPLGNTRAAVTTRAILDARDEGAKINHIGWLFNSTAALSDKFVAVKRGSDIALALSMAREIISCDAHDKDYLIKHTVAPLLVREDTGLFLRASDIGLASDANDYVAVVQGAAVPIKPHDHELRDVQLTGSITVEGVVCKPAFQRLIDHLDKWTLEYQESYTNVPAADVKGLVDDYLEVRPANIYLEEGLRYHNGLQSYRAIQLLAYLTGNVGLEGGGITIIGMGQGHPTGLNDMALIFPEGMENCKGHYINPEDMYEEMKKDNPKFKAYFNFMGNPVHSNPGRKEIWENFFSKMELVVVHEIFMSDTALFADYLLPDTTTFERKELLTQGNHVIYQDAAVARPGEVRPGIEVLSSIAETAGYGSFFDKTEDEWHAIRLDSPLPEFAGVEPPLTLERLKDEKMIRLNSPETLYDPMAAGDFVTPSGRIEFYCEEFADIGMPMATWSLSIMDALSEEEKQAYPLQLFVGRARLFMQTQPFNIMDDLLELHGKEPWMWMNPKDAAARHIHNGDMVKVYNDRGHAVLRAKTSEACPLGVAHMWLNYRASDYKEGGPTYMMIPTGLKENMDVFGHRWREVMQNRWGLAPGEKPSYEAAAEGRMPATMSFDVSIAGNYDIIWDNYCNVEKA